MKPGLHLHCPVKPSGTPPFSQTDIFSHSAPYLLAAHGISQRLPMNPGRHLKTSYFPAGISKKINDFILAGSSHRIAFGVVLAITSRIAIYSELIGRTA